MWYGVVVLNDVKIGGLLCCVLLFKKTVVCGISSVNSLTKREYPEPYSLCPLLATAAADRKKEQRTAQSNKGAAECPSPSTPPRETFSSRSVAIARPGSISSPRGELQEDRVRALLSLLVGLSDSGEVFRISNGFAGIAVYLL